MNEDFNVYRGVRGFVSVYHDALRYKFCFWVEWHKKLFDEFEGGKDFVTCLNKKEVMMGI